MIGNEQGEIIGEEPMPRHVGDVLREQRMQQGRELADIAHQTRIPLRHLSAIENGEHDNLPALPYTIGFVKSYARAIGLDPAAIADQFRSETTKTDKIAPMIDHEPIEDARVPPRRAAVLGLALLGLVALAIVAYSAGWFAGEDAPAPQVAATDAAGSDSGATVAADPAPATPGEVAAPLPPPVDMAAAGGPVAITAREDAWVRIYDRAAGQSVFMGVMAAGDRYEVPQDRQDLLLQTGRVGVLDIDVGTTRIAPLGSANEFVKDVPLTAASLLARGTAPAATVSSPQAPATTPTTSAPTPAQ